MVVVSLSCVPLALSFRACTSCNITARRRYIVCWFVRPRRPCELNQAAGGNHGCTITARLRQRALVSRERDIASLAMETVKERLGEAQVAATRVAGEAADAAATRAGAAWSVYSEKESAAMRSGITRAREVLASSGKSMQAAQERAHEIVATGQSHTEMSVDRVRANVSSAAAEYPEGVVATSTLLFATARGAANGSVLGQSPRLTLLFAAAVSLHQ